MNIMITVIFMIVVVTMNMIIETLIFTIRILITSMNIVNIRLGFSFNVPYLLTRSTNAVTTCVV